MSFDLQPTLRGERWELGPLRHGDSDALHAAARDPLIWEQHPASDRFEIEVFQGFFREALESGGALIATDASTGRVIGPSRFYGYDAANSETKRRMLHPRLPVRG
jgi:hypothetical protein